MHMLHNLVTLAYTDCEVIRLTMTATWPSGGTPDLTNYTNGHHLNKHGLFPHANTQ